VSAPRFAGVDWGTSSFRAWLFDDDGRVLNEVRAADGLLAVGERRFADVLETHLARLGADARTPAVMCGMVGSRTGWVEADYLDAPVALGEIGRLAIRVEDAARPVHILPGIAQRDAVEPDVMRGEETQLLGVVAEGYRTGLVCMPGTHSKWVRLDEGAVAGFSTFMTGELFALLRSRSILAKAVEGEDAVDAAGDAFRGAVRRALDAPALLTGRLFSVRAGWLLHGREPKEGLAVLSGLLIGLELAGAAERGGSLDGCVLLADGAARALYTSALAVAGASGVRVMDADSCVRHGLVSAARTLFPKGDQRP